MKKFFILILLNLCLLSSAYADNYTVIDCIHGDDTTGIALNSEFPYQTLKGGIEKTLSYINSNINKIGNEESASGQIFYIKVECSMNNLQNNTIDLNFNGVQYNDTVVIEGIGNNGLIIQNLRFQLGYNTGNITFRNAQFLNIDTPYFYDYYSPARLNQTHPNSNGIKIIDSYIKLSNNQIGGVVSYAIFLYRFNGRDHYNYFSNYNNQQYIENSIIDVVVDGDYAFKLPGIIKNSQLNFINSTGSLTHDITLVENGNINSPMRLTSSTLISNIIDLGGNNFSTEDSSDIAYINNKFTNFSNFNFGLTPIYFNNFFENKDIVDISSVIYLYNNVFQSGPVDNKDIYNLKKNYQIDTIGPLGVAWKFKRYNAVKSFDIDTTSTLLYKEVTGQNIPEDKDSVYIIYDN